MVSKIFLNFYPENWGSDDLIWRGYFSNGLVQPPTSHLSLNRDLGESSRSHVWTKKTSSEPVWMFWNFISGEFFTPKNCRLIGNGEPQTARNVRLWFLHHGDTLPSFYLQLQSPIWGRFAFWFDEEAILQVFGGGWKVWSNARYNAKHWIPAK